MKVPNIRRSTVLFVLMLLFQICPAGEILAAEPVDSKIEFEFEAGPVWQSRNDAQIPNDRTGTRYSLVDLIGKGPYPAMRFYGTWHVNARHGLRILLAPLAIKDSGVLRSPVDFEGVRFETGESTDAIYKFNSWRLTYRYRMRNGERFSWWLGFTAKVRDAKIRLDQEGVSAKKTDVGFVPLAHLGILYLFNEKWHFTLDIDAIAGGPGRAEDLAIKLGYRPHDRVTLSGGYRTIEGGADVESVYSFAWLHYLVLSGQVNF